MPTYDYKCSNCGETWEKFQSISASPLRKCPKCGKNTAQRLIGTGAGLIFKGSGFYITDYRSDSYKDAAKSEAAPSESNAAADKPADAKAPAETKAPAPAADSKVSKSESPKTEPGKAEKPKSASSSAKKR